MPPIAPDRPRLTLRLILALWFALYCTFALLSPPLLDDADSVHAEVAREMIVRQDPVTLYANGIRYLEKAPLLYWSMAGSMRLFGVHTFTARLPLALTVLLLLLCVEGFARQAFRSARAALYAAVILLSSFGIFIFTRILIPDAMVCLWLACAVWCFWRTEAGVQESTGEAPVWACAGFGAACAMNVLTKGLIGIVFPIGTALVYLLLTRGVRGCLRRLRGMHPIATLLAFLALAAPWHIAAGIANPDQGHPVGLIHSGRWLPFFWRGWNVPDPTWGNVHGWTWFYFVNEHLLRYLNLRVPRDYDTVPLLLFWGLVFVWLMPWSAFLPQAMADLPWQAALRGILFRIPEESLQGRSLLYAAQKMPRLERWLRAEEARPLRGEQKTMLLLGVAAVLPVLFFSFSTRQEYYVLPGLPFFAMLIARWLDREAGEAESMRSPAPLHASGMRTAVCMLAAGSMAALVCGFFLVASKPPSPGIDLSSLLKQNPGEYALSFGHFLDLNAQAMGMFQLPLAIAGAAFFCGTLAAWWARGEFRPHLANMILLASAVTFLVASHIGLTTFSPVLTSKKLADAIREQWRPGEIVIVNDEYEGGSSLGFYLRSSDIHILHGHSANLWYGSFFTDAPPIFESELSVRSRWLSGQRVYLWTAPEKMPEMPTKPFVLAESGGKEIVSNQPNRLQGSSDE